MCIFQEGIAAVMVVGIGDTSSTKGVSHTSSQARRFISYQVCPSIATLPNMNALQPETTTLNELLHPLTLEKIEHSPGNVGNYPVHVMGCPPNNQSKNLNHFRAVMPMQRHSAPCPTSEKQMHSW